MDEQTNNTLSFHPCIMVSCCFYRMYFLEKPRWWQEQTKFFHSRRQHISLTSRLCFRRYFTLLSIIYTRRIGALVQIHMFLFIIVLGLQHVSIFRETLFRFFSFFRRPTYSVPYILDFFILYRAYRPNFVSTFFFLLSRPSDWKKNLQKNSCS